MCIVTDLREQQTELNTIVNNSSIMILSANHFVMMNMWINYSGGAPTTTRNVPIQITTQNIIYIYWYIYIYISIQ